MQHVRLTCSGDLKNGQVTMCRKVSTMELLSRVYLVSPVRMVPGSRAYALTLLP